jgi:hypothetical protein
VLNFEFSCASSDPAFFLPQDDLKTPGTEAPLHHQLIPEELLQRSRKILFISHLAIGDFAYLQNYFLAFSRKYSHLKVDLWVDEVRRTWLFWRWPHLRKYALYDWVEQCPCFNKIYRRTYSLRPCGCLERRHEMRTIPSS